MIVPSTFRQAWWLPGAHLQTLYPSLLRRRRIPPLRRQRVELPDGDFIDVDWTARAASQRVLVLHGLEGSLASHYSGNLLARLSNLGYQAGMMYFRGCSGTPNRLARGYHSGDTADLQYLIEHLHNTSDNPPCAIIGFSLGGNVLLKWLGEQQENAAVQCAVAVSVPFQLDAAARRLQQGMSRIYRNHLLARLRQSVRNKAAHFPPPVPLQRLQALRSFRSFDDAITAPLHGFRDVDEYYSQSSCRQFLGRIRIPTLILQARDDPFLPASALPRETELSDSVTLELAGHGGHVGFIGGRTPWHAEYWLEQRIPDYLATVYRR